MTQRGVSVEMIHGTVREVKEFLDGELGKYQDWNTSDEIIKGICENQRSFETCKGMGVGRPVILKFLKGAIAEWRIAEALDLIKNKRGSCIAGPLSWVKGASI